MIHIKLFEDFNPFEFSQDWEEKPNFDIPIERIDLSKQNVKIRIKKNFYDFILLNTWGLMLVQLIGKEYWVRSLRDSRYKIPIKVGDTSVRRILLGTKVKGENWIEVHKPSYVISSDITDISKQYDPMVRRRVHNYSIPEECVKIIDIIDK